MKGGHSKSDDGKMPELRKDELVSILKKRMNTIIEMEHRLIIQEPNEGAADIENHVNNIVKKHLLNMVNEIKLAIKNIEVL
jgi:hypothetical protein